MSPRANSPPSPPPIHWLCSCGALSTADAHAAFLHRPTQAADESEARDGGLRSSVHVVYPLSESEWEAREIARPLSGIERVEAEREGERELGEQEEISIYD